MTEAPFSISVVLPAYNEGGNIDDTVTAAARFLGAQSFLSAYEIIVVDDGSVDETPAVLESLCRRCPALTVVRHPRNQGYGAALVSGIKQARMAWVLLMDADGQFKIDSLLALIPYMGHYDILAGYRAQRRDPFYRIFLGNLYTGLAAILFQVNLRDINCGFKFFMRNVVDVQTVSAHGGVFYTDFFMTARRQGCRVYQRPVEHFERRKGRQTGVSIKVVLATVIDVLRLLVARR